MSVFLDVFVVGFARRALLFTSAWMYRRHHVPLQEPPWKLCQLADPRVDDASKAAVLSAWDSVSGCCVRQGFARELKRRGVSGSDLISPRREGKVLVVQRSFCLASPKA
jgi:hypothetical protein